MRFTLPITLLAVAASVDAVAVVDHDKRYCSAEGQACDTVKRAADAFADAIMENTKLVTRDETGGQTSLIANRQLHELALAIAASHDDPAKFYSSLGFQGSGTADDEPTKKREAEPWCTQFLGQPCWKKKRSKEAATPVKREAEPWCTQFLGQPCWKRTTPATPDQVKREADPWCTQFLGQPCWKREESSSSANTDVAKREAEPEADAEPWCTQFLGQPCWKRSTPATPVTPSEVKREAEPWCTQFLGQPCWKRDAPAPSEKRAADAEPDRYCTRFTGSSCWKRDGSAAAAEEAKRSTSEGQACWKAKRAAAAVINAIDAGNALKAARDADPGWCRQFLGQPCWKRAASCNGPAGVCTKATRDLHAMYNAARTIIEA